MIESIQSGVNHEGRIMKIVIVLLSIILLVVTASCGGDDEMAHAGICQRICGAVDICYKQGYPDSELVEMRVNCQPKCEAAVATASPAEVDRASACMDTANSCKDYDDVCDIF